MPRYDYVCTCDYAVELTHSISTCDIPKLCRCGKRMRRKVTAPHVEGSFIYPFKLTNIRMPKEQRKRGGIEILNKAEHKRVMKEHNCDTPFLHVGG